MPATVVGRPPTDINVLLPSEATGALGEHFPWDKLGEHGRVDVHFAFEEPPHGPLVLSDAGDDAAKVGPSLHGVVGRSATADFDLFG